MQGGVGHHDGRARTQRVNGVVGAGGSAAVVACRIGVAGSGQADHVGGIGDVGRGGQGGGENQRVGGGDQIGQRAVVGAQVAQREARGRFAEGDGERADLAGDQGAVGQRDGGGQRCHNSTCNYDGQRSGVGHTRSWVSYRVSEGIRSCCTSC